MITPVVVAPVRIEDSLEVVLHTMVEPPVKSIESLSPKRTREKAPGMITDKEIMK
jgi:hypothetical protein